MRYQDNKQIAEEIKKKEEVKKDEEKTLGREIKHG